MNDYIERKSIRNMYSCLNPNDRVRAEQVVTDIDAIPSADAVSLEEFEQMRFLADKSIEMVGEPTWTDVLAEIHSRFNALEKELRKASAEMSAIIREYVGRPKGEWIYTNNPLRLDDEWACSRCGNISFVRTNFCDRCGADMRKESE